jgi:3-dehydroquinate synthetase
VLHALRRCGLHVHARGLAPDAILAAMRVDKKRANGELRFVLPARLGDVRFGCEVPESAVDGAVRELQMRAASAGW